MHRNNDLSHGDNKYANALNHSNTHNPFKRSMIFARMKPAAKKLFAAATSKSKRFFDTHKADYFSTFETSRKGQ